MDASSEQKMCIRDRYETGHVKDTYQLTHWIDRIITHKYFGFPIFIALTWLMFEVTFSLGQYPMDWIEDGVGWLGDIISQHFPQGPIKDMLVDGVIGGVGAVIVFLPQILILYCFISFMEDLSLIHIFKKSFRNLLKLRRIAHFAG